MSLPWISCIACCQGTEVVSVPSPQSFIPPSHHSGSDTGTLPLASSSSPSNLASPHPLAPFRVHDTTYPSPHLASLHPAIFRRMPCPYPYTSTHCHCRQRRAALQMPIAASHHVMSSLPTASAVRQWLPIIHVHVSFCLRRPTTNTPSRLALSYPLGVVPTEGHLKIWRVGRKTEDTPHPLNPSAFWVGWIPWYGAARYLDRLARY
ncbi:hypothetical protein LZ30DRAFT_743509 [Colletotrichum cereale]|nr:hypothetical protein LZ30DRAFT_743509 [Colletotrichum cereale]